MTEPSLTDPDFEALAAFRLEIRRYLNFAQHAAEVHGLTMQQHQALLVIRTAPEAALSVGELADLLFLKHHSSVELTDRLVKAGLVERGKDDHDGRKAVLHLTDLGAAKLNALAASHLGELHHSGPALARTLSRLLKLRKPPQLAAAGD
jgi:DNA-binding MarR family transcriptional regulator